MSIRRLARLIACVALVAGAGFGYRTSGGALKTADARISQLGVVVPEVPAARQALERHRTRFGPWLTGPSTISRIERAGDWLRPVPAGALGRAADRAASLLLPERADRPFRLGDEGSGASIEVTIAGLAPAPAEAADGYVVYRRAHSSGGDFLQRPTADGTEDYLVFEAPPERAHVSYSVALGAGITGLRLLANTLEFLDESGNPRLRMSSPYILDRDGTVHAASVAVTDCAFDASPLPPWGRPVTVPGASRCTVDVQWVGKDVSYPAILDPSWTATLNTMSVARMNHTGTLLNVDPQNHIARVLIAGGRTASGARTSTVDVYDPSFDRFAPTGSMSCPRELHTATLLADGRVLVVGGLTSGDGLPGGLPDAACSVAEVYNPSTGTWTQLTLATSLPIWGHAASRIDGGAQSGKVLITGGRTTPSSKPTSGAWLFNPVTGTFLKIPSLPASRYLHGQAAQSGGGKVVVGGGKCPDCTALNTALEADTDVADATKISWKSSGSTAASQEGPTLVRVFGGQAIIVGGGNSGTATATSQVHEFDSTGWHDNSSMTAARRQHRGALLSDGRVLVAGGTDAAGTVLSSVDVWDQTTNTWSALAPMNLARASHSITGMQAGKVLAAGGFTSGGGVTNTAEVFPDTPPPPPLCDATVCDPAIYDCVGDLCIPKQCSAGTADCDGSVSNGCETPLNTLTNCGACGVACSRDNGSASCAAGSCQLAACNPGFDNCDGNPANGCETPLNTLTNCGACGVACSRDNGSASCAAGSCQLAACNPGFDNCDGNPANGCETPLNTVVDCGGCGVACPAPANASPQCVAETCTFNCNQGLTNCGNAGCVDPSNDPNNCGACGHVCAQGLSCVNGQCTPACSQGQALCASGCADLSNDPGNCGACGLVCPQGLSCVNGQCITTCSQGQALCPSGCVDLSNDPSNCGACGNVCAQGLSCVNGQCITTCSQGQALCPSGCADLSNDPNNCGACGHVCPQGLSCVNGQCITTCSQGQALCPSGCVDLSNDPSNCGACGNVCPAPPNGTATCSAGACAIATCSAGYGDCNGVFTDGCESNLNARTTRTGSAVTAAYPIPGYIEGITNCGACGVTCDDGNECTTDLCVPGGSGSGECRHFNRNICATARCSSHFVSCGCEEPGDQAACAGTDSDDDNLPDAWETASLSPYTGATNPVGIDINCDGVIDPTTDFLYPANEEPNPATKDVYLRIRAMGQRPSSLTVACGSDVDCAGTAEPYCNFDTGACSDEPTEGHRLSQGVIDSIKATFQNHGIALHVDYDPSAVIPHADYVKFLPDDVCSVPATATFFPDGSPLDSLKVAPYWDDRLRYVYHFAVLAHSWCVNPDISGNSEIFGNDSIVTLGTSTFALTGEAQARHQAGTLMHELGHNLGLTHLSPPNSPNILSVMNHRYQFAGIVNTSGDWRVDYSSEVLPTLDENHLDETIILTLGSTDLVTFSCPGGVARSSLAGAPIDWNCDGDASDTDVSVNIDGVVPISLDVHVGREEWSTLRHDFQCQASFPDPCPSCGAACEPGFTDCDGDASNGCEASLGSDPNNCGACGHVCAQGLSCVNGQCITTCSQGQTLCLSGCADLSNDPSNCGACGNLCPSGASCVNSQCICPMGQIDDTPPAIAFGSSAPAANASGWNNADVSIPYTVSDACGVDSVSPASPLLFSSEGANQTVTVTACDHSGNCASAVSPAVSIDLTPPSITALRSPLANGYGWNNTDVTVHFDCDGAISGVASLTPDAVLSGEGASQSAMGTCVDSAGNSASTTVDAINIDKGIPTLNSLTVPSIVYYGAFFTITATASDAPSGFTMSRLTIPEWSESKEFLHNLELTITDEWTQRALRLGAFTVKWFGLDAAGNERDPDVQSRSRLPDTPGAFAGAFLWPIPNSQFELGSSLPIRFKFVDVEGNPLPEFCGTVVLEQAPGVRRVVEASWNGTECQVNEQLVEESGYQAGPVTVSLPRDDDAVLGHTRSIAIGIK